ncbi:MAG: alanine racemase [Actinobacteria bacterium]|nr:alanine racemase [Actinomycetota bacterium]
MARRALARVNLAAVERNCERLRFAAGPHTALCAVVKANGYGHGAVPVARAALAGGASWLAVAAAGEATELRAAGIEAPILTMGALSAEELPLALAAHADVVAWRPAFVQALRRCRHAWPGDGPIRVHVKLDVGMGRLGIRDADELLRVAEQVEAADELELVGAMTHLPCADEDPERTRAEVARFAAFGERLRALKPGAILHAANSAATLALPEARLDMVRCGVAIYGLDPFGADAAAHDLEPALALRSYVAALKPLSPGESVGYGATFVAREPTWIATLPIGYGDGFRRAFSDNAEVLIGGRRHPLVGRVSMDNMTVDLGPHPGAIVEGEEAVLLGRQGDERITAEELAGRIDTINYEITTALTARPTRAYDSDGIPLAGDGRPREGRETPA